MNIITSKQLGQELKLAGIAVTGVELHGFLSGLVCGGIQDDSWQTLMYQFTSENNAYPTALLQRIKALYQHISIQLADINQFEFNIDLAEPTDAYQQADFLSEWVNHFILGLGLAQPKLSAQTGDIAEAVADLRQICELGYDENDDVEELSAALEEITEYLRTIASLFFTHFSQHKTTHLIH